MYLDIKQTNIPLSNTSLLLCLANVKSKHRRHTGISLFEVPNNHAFCQCNFWLTCLDITRCLQTMRISLADNVCYLWHQWLWWIWQEQRVLICSLLHGCHISLSSSVVHSIKQDLPKQCETQDGRVTLVSPNHPFHKYWLCSERYCFFTETIAGYISYRGWNRKCFSSFLRVVWEKTGLFVQCTEIAPSAF